MYYFTKENFKSVVYGINCFFFSLFQMYPGSLCKKMRLDGQNYEFGWVGLIRPESVSAIPGSCTSIYEMVSNVLSFF